MELYSGEAMNSLRTAQDAINSDSQNYWEAVKHAANLIRHDGVAELDAIAQAGEQFGLSGDELLPMSEAIDNLLREEIEQEHQPSGNWEP